MTLTEIPSVDAATARSAEVTVQILDLLNDEGPILTEQHLESIGGLVTLMLDQCRR